MASTAVFGSEPEPRIGVLQGGTGCSVLDRAENPGQSGTQSMTGSLVMYEHRLCRPRVAVREEGPVLTPRPEAAPQRLTCADGT